jgi:hypothetical protein
MTLSISTNEIAICGKLNMKTRQAVRGLFTLIRNRERGSSRWPMVAAFITGMVLTAATAQTLVFANELTHKEVIPVPQNTPKLYEPGIFPDKNPPERQITELVYAFPEEAPISS